jgi:uncharacterized protein
MTPDDAIHGFGTARIIPRDEIVWAREHWEELFPRLRTLLAACMAGIDRSEITEGALFFLLHLAAEKSDTRIHAGLCRLLLDPELPDVILGDAVTESLTGLLINTYDDDPAPMQAVVESAACEAFVRGGALMALAYLTHDGRLTHSWMRGYLWRLYEEVLPRESSNFWTDWVGAIAALGYQDLVPQVEEAFRHGWVDRDVMELKHFRDDLRRSLADPDSGVGFKYGDLPFADTIDMLEHWGFGADVGRSSIGAGPESWIPPDLVPHVNPVRHVGRNDPCPCGSGKKYKKCCLGT